MRAVLQRVSNASVVVDGDTVGRIERGLLVYLGVAGDDEEQDILFMAKKVPSMRLFTDEQDKMNLSVRDVNGAMLVVSQFTLCADLKKGNRPSFNPAAEPGKARTFYERFVSLVREQGITVETGSFGASMQVSYVNEGPVTIVLDSPKR